MERETVAPPAPEALEQPEGEERAAVTARTEVHLDEASVDEDGLAEGLEMTEDEDNVGR